jgi:hypothetical protein
MINKYFKTYNSLYSILNFFFFFIIALIPLYIFPPGSIQISHFFLLIFSVLVFMFIGISLDKYFYIFLFFLIYCLAVEVFYIFYNTHVSKYYNLKFLKHIFFLSFNFITVISLVSFFNHQKKFNFIFNSLASAFVIILISYYYQSFFGITTDRFSSFFNNPNQLGYFSVCSFSLIYLLYRNFYISYYLMIGSITLLVIFSIFSFSKAAIISLFPCVLFAITPYNNKYYKIIILIFFLLIIFFITFFYLQIFDTSFFNLLINDVENFPEERGYLVFLEANLPEAIFGMGLNKVYELQSYEIHSTFIMILTSYGFIGLLIFNLLMLYWVLDIKKSFGLNGAICICGPSLLYGLSHNGIRFSMFWIVFATSIAFSRKLIKQKNFKEH